MYTFEDDATDEESALEDNHCEDEREINIFMDLDEPVDEGNEDEEI